jgi:O-methyltransferase
MSRLLQSIRHLFSFPNGNGHVLKRQPRERQCRQEFFYNAFTALAFNGIDGDYAEFGCHQGMTFQLAYQESRRQGLNTRLWAFDSFQGMPAPRLPEDEHPRWKQGTMATSLERFHAICRSNGIPPTAYEVVAGFYDRTLKALSPDDPPTNSCLAYVDCDMYSSTRAVLEFLLPRLKHGLILAFDDFFCWTVSRVSGNQMAMQEVLGSSSKWELIPYTQFGWHGKSFVLVSREAVFRQRAKA